jgi:membrane fusion protein, heavy metal efflux system
VAPGAPLMELRLTHDSVVDRQRALLLALEQREVVQREVARLEEVAASGAVAGKTLLERQYELQTIEATIRAERQALVLHGLSVQQVERIAADRQLLATLEIAAPPLLPGEHYLDDYHVVELNVRPGEHVEAGAPLAVLADHCELYVEGKAFEDDAAALHRASDAGLGVGVLIPEGDRIAHLSPLSILYVENQVDRESRALRFFLPLPNQLAREHQTPAGRRFHAWRFKPGQRVEVEVPVERWEGRVVLPVEAVVQEGADWFVFRELDEHHFMRRDVHVEHRDHRWVVIAADGTLADGDRVAARGAYQIHLALKQRAGGSDEHAHHHHH